MSKNEIKSIDGIELLNKKLKWIMFLLENQPKITIKKRLSWYLAGITGWIEGNCSFKDTFQNLFPARFFDKKIEVRHRIRECVIKKFSNILRSYEIFNFNKISLFDHIFYPGIEKGIVNSWFHTFKFIDQVIVSDQYNAKKFIKEDFIIIDAGANVGTFAVFAANLAPKGHVYCFEPSPKTFEILKKNTKDYPNITIFQKALGEKEKSVELVINEGDLGANTLVDGGMDYSKFDKKVKVEVITLDKFIKEIGVDKIDFIKIDTEGYEKNIIKGSKQIIKNFSPVMAMSAYHHLEDKKELPAFIKSIDPEYKFRIDVKSEEDLIFSK